VAASAVAGSRGVAVGWPRCKVAKAKGRLRGKQPKLNHRQEAHLVALLNGGEYSTAELADLFGVARSTVCRAVERERVRAIVGSAAPLVDTCLRCPAGHRPAGRNPLWLSKSLGHRSWFPLRAGLARRQLQHDATDSIMQA
jgi:hypothetical protein